MRALAICGTNILEPVSHTYVRQRPQALACRGWKELPLLRLCALCPGRAGIHKDFGGLRFNAQPRLEDLRVSSVSFVKAFCCMVLNITKRTCLFAAGGASKCTMCTSSRAASMRRAARASGAR